MPSQRWDSFHSYVDYRGHSCCTLPRTLWAAWPAPVGRLPRVQARQSPGPARETPDAVSDHGDGGPPNLFPGHTASPASLRPGRRNSPRLLLAHFNNAAAELIALGVEAFSEHPLAQLFSADRLFPQEA